MLMSFIFKRYYLSRGGSTQTNPKFTAFPKGFRMVAGDPFRRNNTLQTNADKANTWAWYGMREGGGREYCEHP
jgi:hypothetical protein